MDYCTYLLFQKCVHQTAQQWICLDQLRWCSYITSCDHSHLGNQGRQIHHSLLWKWLHILSKINKCELQISCVFVFFTLWKRVKMHVLSDQSVHITHTYCCVSKLSKFGAYLYSRVHNNTFLSLRNPRNYFTLYFSKERAYTFEGYRMLAFLSIDVKRDLIGCLR